MPVTVRIPGAMRSLMKNQAEVQSEGEIVADVIANLDRKYPGIRDRVFDESGNKRKFVNVYLNSEDIRFLQAGSTPVKSGDEIDLVVAIAGG